MAAPLNTCTTIEQRGVVCFLWVKIWKQRISTKKCCPCTVNLACHVKQSSKTRSFGGTLSWRWRSGQRSVRVVPTATTRILRRRFPGTCETVGQVFKFVWRLRWKINAVCMSLSTIVSFQLRFVTYLLTFSRISCRIFLCSLTLSNTFSFLTWSVQLIFSILLQNHISKFSRCFWSAARNTWKKFWNVVLEKAGDVNTDKLFSCFKFNVIFKWQFCYTELELSLDDRSAAMVPRIGHQDLVNCRTAGFCRTAG